MLNPPTVLQEETIHDIIHRMTIPRPRTQEVLPRWHLSVVLKGLMKPPFVINGSDRNIPLELLSYKTAFLIALATGARGSELVALSRAPHNLQFKMLETGDKQAYIRMVHPEKSTPWADSQTPGVSWNCPSLPTRTRKTSLSRKDVSLYAVKTTVRAKEDPQQKLFVHFSRDVQLFTTHFRRWVAETIRLTYENSSQNDLPKIRVHDGRAVAALITYYRNTPLSENLPTYRLEIFQRARPTLSGGYGSRYRIPGPVSGGCTDGPPLELRVSTHRSPPPPTWVNFGIVSMAGGSIR